MTHNQRYDVSNHQPLDCLLNRLLRCRSKKTLNPTSLAGGFPTKKKTSNAENLSISWRHNGFVLFGYNNFSEYMWLIWHRSSGCLTCTGTIVWSSQCLWVKICRYHTRTKHKKARTLCTYIFWNVLSVTTPKYHRWKYLPGSLDRIYLQMPGNKYTNHPLHPMCLLFQKAKVVCLGMCYKCVHRHNLFHIIPVRVLKVRMHGIWRASSV